MKNAVQVSQRLRQIAEGTPALALPLSTLGLVLVVTDMPPEDIASAFTKALEEMQKEAKESGEDQDPDFLVAYREISELVAWVTDENSG